LNSIASQFLSSIRTTAKQLWQGGRGWILITISAGWFLSLGIRFIYPALVPFFRTEFQVDLTIIGLLLTSLWGAYALGQLPGGILGDRFGEGNILVFSTGISGLTLLVISTSANLPILFIGTVAFGFATALFGPTRYTVFTDIYSLRAGSAIGLTTAAGSAGSAVLPIVATAIATSISWRLSFSIFIPLFIGVTVALWLSVPGRTSGTESAVDAFSYETLRRIIQGIKQKPIPVLVVVQIFLSFVLQGFVGFFPAYLIDIKGLSPGNAALLFTFFFGVSLFVQPLAGVLMDRLGTRRALVSVLSLAVLGLWVLPFVSGFFSLAGTTVVLSSLSGYIVITQTSIADALPTDMKGTGLGALRTVWMLIGSTSPVIIGFLGDSGLFNEAFFLLATIASFALLLSHVRI